MVGVAIFAYLVVGVAIFAYLMGVVNTHSGQARWATCNSDAASDQCGGGCGLSQLSELNLAITAK